MNNNVTFYYHCAQKILNNSPPRRKDHSHSPSHRCHATGWPAHMSGGQCRLFAQSLSFPPCDLSSSNRLHLLSYIQEGRWKLQRYLRPAIQNWHKVLLTTFCLSK